MKKYKDICLGFSRAGILGFGGGVACLPLIKREVVTNYGWINDDEFAEIVAISNTLPGPINTKMAGYIGYRIAGVFGAILAVCATILPSAIMLIILLETLLNFREHPVVSGMLAAIVPVIGVMLALMAWQFLTSAAKEMKHLVMAIYILLIIMLVVVLNIHPALVVAGVIITAVAVPSKVSQPEEGSDHNG